MLYLSLFALSYYSTQEFKSIKQYIQNKTRYLNNENKNKFRSVCLELADYLIRNKTAPLYRDKNKWEGTLKEYIKPYYKHLTKYGGCPVILYEKDKAILDLQYEVHDFCEKKNVDLKEISRLKKLYSNKCVSTWARKCNEYNVWINERQKFFKTKESLIKDCYQETQTKRGSKKSSCNILNPETFNTLDYCVTVRSNLEGQSAYEEGNSQKVHPNGNIEQTESQASTQKGAEVKHEQTQPETGVQLEQETHQEGISSPPDTPTTNDTSMRPEDAPPKASMLPQVEEKLPLGDTTSESKNDKDLKVKQVTNYPSVSSERLPNVVNSSVIHQPPNISGLFKKRKKIKRRQVKFLRIPLPSYSNIKKKFLTYDHLEHPIYDNEEIMKKIKIRDNSTKKNVNSSKLTKNRHKTIIEVHMEVLEEFRNKEWEFSKGEFLEICLEVFNKDDDKTYTNLENAESLLENTKCSSDIERKKILWNKWIERHRNISENLKKEVWFNNLKNEWKKEHNYIKESKKSKKNPSNKIQKVPFLEREKDIWRQWIIKNKVIIEQCLEHNSFNEFTELKNISEVYENEQNIINLTLINIKELQQRESFEELYRCIKENIVEKLCILVYMTILEECNNEENIENRKLYLDSSINDWKTEEYLDRKHEITENMTDINRDVLHNKKNNEIHNCARDYCLRKDIDEWIMEDNTIVNSISKENNELKSDQIEE
ncbi:STP1 protein [Plasmodium brasilianum]|uniref:STP1 protein n=1 Tax=Plasmodium brasilianum TaxID=5824 RepID=A0ACB9Y6W1_PLABR|nr:STP1 protein [Plasmodium brasilianum]